MVEFYLLMFSHFPLLTRQNKNPALTRIELMTSALTTTSSCARLPTIIDYSGNGSPFRGRLPTASIAVPAKLSLVCTDEYDNMTLNTNLNVFQLSEHPPDQGGKVVKTFCWGTRL